MTWCKPLHVESEAWHSISSGRGQNVHYDTQQVIGDMKAQVRKWYSALEISFIISQHGQRECHAWEDSQFPRHSGFIEDVRSRHMFGKVGLEQMLELLSDTQAGLVKVIGKCLQCVGTRSNASRWQILFPMRMVPSLCEFLNWIYIGAGAVVLGIKEVSVH